MEGDSVATGEAEGDGEIAGILEGSRGVVLVIREVLGWRGGLYLRWGRQLDWGWRWLDGRPPLWICFLRRNSGGGREAGQGGLLMPWRVAGVGDGCSTFPVGWGVAGAADQ